MGGTERRAELFEVPLRRSGKEAVRRRPRPVAIPGPAVGGGVTKTLFWRNPGMDGSIAGRVESWRKLKGRLEEFGDAGSVGSGTGSSANPTRREFFSVGAAFDESGPTFFSFTSPSGSVALACFLCFFLCFFRVFSADAETEDPASKSRTREPPVRTAASSVSASSPLRMAPRTDPRLDEPPS